MVTFKERIHQLYFFVSETEEKSSWIEQVKEKQM